MSAHLLYVEDDERLSFVTLDNLTLRGYRVTHCADGREALALLGKDQYDLYILDVMLPGVDGFDIAREIRRTDTETPILFLSARSLEEDRIHGFRTGADDYITKPFSIEELVLRMEVFLRRSRRSEAGVQRVGAYAFDPQNLTLVYGDDIRRLTQRESDLLLMLLQHRGQVLKRSYILERLWGQDDYFLGRSLDVFISRLRRYLAMDSRVRIETVHGVGFKLEEQD
jgi:two-component system, OmpR family, response regulator VicR